MPVAVSAVTTAIGAAEIAVDVAYASIALYVLLVLIWIWGLCRAAKREDRGER